MDASKLLQLRNTSEHRSGRPNPQPLQTSQHDSDSSASSSDSSRRSSDSPVSSTESTGYGDLDNYSDVVRCSRCQRSASMASPFSSNNFVKYGLNLHYCRRCAERVGYNR